MKDIPNKNSVKYNKLQNKQQYYSLNEQEHKPTQVVTNCTIL